MAGPSQLMRDTHGISVMGLQELTFHVHANRQITPDVVDAIEVHAAALSQTICDDFTMLNAIVTRHEALLHLRWQNKTVAKRRIVLLDAWPNMPKDHHPDFRATKRSDVLKSALADVYVWPFINQEDLVTTKTLPTFLSTRGYKSPWEFAAIELEFSPILEWHIKGCADQTLCDTLTIEFSEIVDPSVYGKLNRNSTTNTCGHDSKYEICARRGFQTLLIQQRILSFLLACSRAILHDKTEKELLWPVMKTSPIIETVRDSPSQQISFTSVLNMAPYRGWSSINFSRLRGYVESTLDKHKSHVWALREDPGYFADTIQECLSHHPINVPSDCGCDTSQTLNHPWFINELIKNMLHESYDMINGWNYLKERLDDFDRLSEEGATKQLQARPILEFYMMTRHIGCLLLDELHHGYRATPGCRSLFKKECKTNTYHRTGSITFGQKHYLTMMSIFCQNKDKEFDRHCYMEYLFLLSWHLEAIDETLQKNPTAQKMVTGRILDLLTDLSIITECRRQASLWKRSPDVETGKVDACMGQMQIEDRDGVDFFAWRDALKQDLKSPVHLIFPLKEKLNYPEHKKRTPTTTAAMCKAERNLDLFWAAIDSHFEAKTGLAQHRVIKDCLLDSHMMRRTVPWEQSATRSAKSTHSLDTEYQPIFNHLHDHALQITGSFDRLSIAGKIKPKTRGTDPSKLGSLNEAPEESNDSKICFKVKKQTYKVFRTLLHTALLDDGEAAKQVKWADFIKAMGDMGFAVEKLQGSAWQFIPNTDVGAKRSIQFHEPHPVSDVNPVIASRMGRRLNRVYGWSGDMFSLA